MINLDFKPILHRLITEGPNCGRWTPFKINCLGGEPFKLIASDIYPHKSLTYLHQAILLEQLNIERYGGKLFCGFFDC